MTTFSNRPNAWAETDTWLSCLHPQESGQKEEGPQQGQGVPALPCTGSSIFFQRTPEGIHTGSSPGKDMGRKGTCHSTRSRKSSVCSHHQRTGVRIFTGEKWTSPCIPNLTFLPNDFLHLTFHLIFEPDSLPCESRPGIITLTLQLAE